MDIVGGEYVLTILAFMQVAYHFNASLSVPFCLAPFQFLTLTVDSHPPILELQQMSTLYHKFWINPCIVQSF